MSITILSSCLLYAPKIHTNKAFYDMPSYQQNVKGYGHLVMSMTDNFNCKWQKFVKVEWKKCFIPLRRKSVLGLTIHFLLLIGTIETKMSNAQTFEIMPKLVACLIYKTNPVGWNELTPLRMVVVVLVIWPNMQCWAEFYSKKILIRYTFWPYKCHICDGM